MGVVLKKKVTPPAAAPVKKVVGKKALPVKKVVPTKKVVARRSADDDTDEAEAPRRAMKATGKKAAAGRKVVREGWGGAELVQSEVGTFARVWKPEDNTTYVIRVLGTAPYASFAQHWVTTGVGKDAVTRSYICLGADVCPLCAIGDKPNGQYNFAIAVLLPGEEPSPQTLGAGITVYNQLKALQYDKRKGPLDAHYYEVSRTKTGSGRSTKYNWSFGLVRDRDLEADFGIDLLTEEQLEDLNAHKPTADDIEKEKRSVSQLEEIAAEMSGGDYDE